MRVKYANVDYNRHMGHFVVEALTANFLFLSKINEAWSIQQENEGHCVVAPCLYLFVLP